MPLDRMSESDLIAASECVNLMALLADSGSPHSKELALIVGMRLVAIADNGKGDEGPSVEEIAKWIELSRELVGSEDEENAG